MSTIVVVKKGDEVVMASDSLTTFGNHVIPGENYKANKILKFEDCLIGITGWALYNDIFLDYIKGKNKLSFSNKADVFQFFNVFWSELHKKYSFVNDQCNEKESPFGDFDASFLIVTKKHIFLVSSNGSVYEIDNYYAIGSGSDYALGALYNIDNSGLNIHQLAEQAIKTGIAFDKNSGGKISIESL
ncbi:MAG: hypothetical protein GY828_07575 [Candidatus Gracilibacteria bacterium]|nr:hypothetical protein [Candidatus Gracilibacteria bacterium]